MVITDEQLRQLLLKDGIVDASSLSKLEEYAKAASISLTDALIEKDVITDEHLGMMIADSLKIPFIVLSKISIPEDVITIIPERFARKHQVIPFAREGHVTKIAMVNPTDEEAIRMIAQKTGGQVIPHLASEREVYNTLHLYRKDLQHMFDGLIKETMASGPTDSPVAKIVDLIIETALEEKASDVHIEPQEKQSLVRFRIDGILHDVLFIPKAIHDQVVTRIKIMSRLRTDEHLAPQDGKFRSEINDEQLDVRVSILPVADGEKVVMRLLASKFRQFSLVDLGMSPKDMEKVNRGIQKTYGMILSTGPTGSGKTTSIYAILKILNSREKNITTIEDPIEYRMKGVNQIQVNQKTNLTFASGLRSILRQDPNIIFVGEIRDGETAGIAVNAALTGHLVLSTLHTNDAPTALPRLIDMQIEPFLVASTVNVIIAQRLLRKICEMCKLSYTISREELKHKLPSDVSEKFFGTKTEVTLYKGRGCRVCHESGYLGRLGVFEVLEITKEMKDLIVKREDADVIGRKAQEEGMTTMFEDGLQKIISGLTTIEEVLRVTKI